MSFLVPLELLLEVPNAAPRIKLNPEDPAPFLPKAEDLESAIEGDPNFLKSYLETTLKPLFTNELRPLMLKIVRRPQSISSFQRKELRGFRDPQAIRLENISNLGYKLYSQKIKRGLEMVIDYVDHGTVPAYTSTAGAVRIIEQLRQFEGALIRVGGARIASVNSGIPLQNVLALYRTEGNFLCPNSFSSLTNHYPPIESDFSYLIWLRSPIPNLSTGTFLWETQEFLKQYPADGSRIALLGFLTWLLIIPGFDKLVIAMNPQFTQRIYRVSEMRSGFARFSHDNWDAAGKASSIPQAESRFDRLLDNFKLEALIVNGVEVIRYSPRDPTQLVGDVLTEALMYHIRWTRYYPEFEKLDYLIYHQCEPGPAHDPRLGHVRIKHNKFFKLLVSAFTAAKRSTNPAFSSLKTKLANVPMPEEVLFDSEYPGVYKTIKTNLPVNFNYELMNDFIMNAKYRDWNDWEVPRANNFRYHELLRYYTALLA